jgi:hypothetical protein
MAEMTEKARRVVLDRRRREVVLLAAWQDARAVLAGMVAKRDRLVARSEGAVCTVLGMTPREVLLAERHARTGRYPTTIAARLHFATFVHHRKQVEEVKDRWAERIVVTQRLVDEAAINLREATQAMLEGTTGQTVEELTGLTRRQLAGLAGRRTGLPLPAR